MEEDEFIPQIIEPTPIIKEFRCRFLMYLLYIFVTFSPAFAGLWIWYEYNFWIAVGFFLFFTLAMGIVLSKMRISSIPPSQREISYNNKEIIRWYIDKNLCLF